MDDSDLIKLYRQGCREKTGCPIATAILRTVDPDAQSICGENCPFTDKGSEMRKCVYNILDDHTEFILALIAKALEWTRNEY